MWDITHSYVGHDSSVCQTRLFQRHSLIYRCTYVHRQTKSQFSYVWHDSFLCGTWLICMSNTFSTNIHRCIDVRMYIDRPNHSFHMCAMTHSYVRHDPIIRGIRLIHMCGMTHPYVRHDSFMCESWLIRMCDVTRLPTCVTWLIHRHTRMYRYMYVHTPTP